MRRVAIAALAALLVGGGAVGRMTAPAPSFDSTLLPAANVVANYASPDDAVRALTVAQQQYQSAAAFLASQDTTSRFIGLNRDTYEARLAALDEIAALTRAALYRAPQDPMLNQYYLTTLGAREATLRELGFTGHLSAEGADYFSRLLARDVAALLRDEPEERGAPLHPVREEQP